MTKSYLIYEVGVSNPTRWDVVRHDKDLCEDPYETHAAYCKINHQPHFFSYKEALEYVISQHKLELENITK